MKGGMMMSFLNKICNYQQSIKKSSLQACHKASIKYSRIIEFLCSKRMSSFLLSGREGSMTIEASLAIPLFLFAILNLFSIIILFGEYSSNLADMHREAKELSVHAHIMEEGQNVGNDLIIRTKVQALEPMFPIMGFSSARTIINCRVRKWTGYDVTNGDSLEKEEEWVYVTFHGTTYHRNRNCSYLNPKIMSSASKDIDQYRNKDGERYRLCSSCKDGNLTGICFYTEYGNRYHTSLRCSQLTRSVQTIRLSEAGNRHACSKCGNE